MLPMIAMAGGVSFYDGCIFNFVTTSSGSDSSNKSFTLATVPGQCYTDCYSSCKTFSTKNSGEQEINNDLIYQCIQTCQSGQSYSAHKRMINTTVSQQEYTVKNSDSSTPTKKTSTVKLDTYYYEPNSTTVAPAASCCLKSDQIKGCYTTDDLPDQNIYVSDDTFNSKSTVIIAISDRDAAKFQDSNKIYACGRRSILLTPIFPNIFNKFSHVVTGGDASVQASLDYKTTQVNWQYFNGANGLDTGKISNMKNTWTVNNQFNEWGTANGLFNSCLPGLADNVNQGFINSANPSLNVTNNSLWVCGSQWGFYQNVQACRWGVFLSDVSGGTITSGIDISGFKIDSATLLNTDGIIHLIHLGKKDYAVNEWKYGQGNCKQTYQEIQKMDESNPNYQKKVDSLLQCINNYVEFDTNSNITSILKIQDSYVQDSDTPSIGNGIFNKMNYNGEDYLVNRDVFRDNYGSVSSKCASNGSKIICSKKVSSYSKVISVNPNASIVPFKGKLYKDASPTGVYVSAPASPTNPNPVQTLYTISQQDPACYWDWHVRNAKYTTTGINLADGDEISISWGGDTFVGNGDISKYVDYKLAKYAYANGGYRSITNFDNNLSTQLISPDKLLREMSGLDIAWVQRGGNVNKDAIFGEDGRAEKMEFCNGKSLPALNRKWYGLSGSVVDGLMILNNKSDQAVNCSDIVDPGLARYSFAGVIQGLTTNGARYGLSLRHHVPYSGNINTDNINNDPFSNDGLSYYNSALGGQQVTIDWGGCPMTQGDGIKCGFVAIDDQSSDNNIMKKPAPGYINSAAIPWQDLSQNFISAGRVAIQVPDDNKADTKYRLYCKLDTSNYVSGLKSDARPEVVAMSKPSSAVGGYHMVIESSLAPDWKQSNSLMRQVIDSVMQTMLGTTCVYGKEQAGGIVKTIYMAVAKNVAPYVTVLMTLFLCFTGIAYMMGLAKMNQQDALNRLLKMAFILAVTSPTGWEFFGGQMVQAVSCGSLQIASKIVVNVNAKNASDSFYNQAVANQPTSIYDEVLDGPRVMIFNDVVWKKMGALFITGLTGIILVLVILVSAFLIWLATIRAGLIYIFSIIATCLLFITAPLFFVFLLFSQTRSMFDEWCKNVIAYTLVPIVLFGSMSLFAMIVIALIYSTLNFTICPTCVINIPILNICMLSGWQNIAASHYPPAPGILSFFSPFGAMVGGLCLIIASYGMLQFAKMSTDVVIRVVTFNASIQRAGIANIPTQMAKGAYETGAKGLSKAQKLGSKALKVLRQ